MSSLTFRVLIIVTLTSVSAPAAAMPNIRTEFGKTPDGFVRVKVFNQTNRDLACYVGIDGRKIKFRLTRNNQSTWYKATDTRYTYKSFTTWCDYIESYPEYQ
jgi:hypothetical protein